MNSVPCGGVFVVIFFKTKYNISFGFCAILNDQDLSKCYQPRPSARMMTLTYFDLDITKTSSNNSLWLFSIVIEHHRSSCPSMGLAPRSPAPVPKWPISANPGSKFCFTLCIHLPMHYFGWHFVISFLFFEVKAQQYFVSSSYMFWDRKTFLKIRLNPGLNLTISWGTWPWCQVQPATPTHVVYFC